MSLLLKWLEGLSIDVTISDRCLRKTSPKSTCTTCTEHCRVDAITIENDSIQHNLDKCDSCGGCITSCPVGAIQGTVPNRTFKNGMLCYEPHFLPTVKELLIFHKKGMKGIAIPNGWNDLEWKKTIDEANEILIKLKQEPFIFQRVVELKEPELTRRQLFISAQKKGKHFAMDLMPASWKQGSNNWSLPFHYPDVQFYEAVLDQEKCTLCKGCFFLCPQKVFSVTDTNVFVDHQKCTNCGLCEDVCREGAVEVREQVGERSVDKLEIVSGKCKRCKREYLSFGNDKGHCHVCENIPSDWLRP